MRAGDPVLLRSICLGNVRWAFPHRFVGTWDCRLGVYCAPGNAGKLVKRGMPAGHRGYLQWWVTDAPPFDWVWRNAHVLRFMRRGDRQTVELCWDEAWSFLGIAEAETLGVVTDVEGGAATVRTEGERVVEERPWPTGWEGWRPPAEWVPLDLPDKWDVA